MKKRHIITLLFAIPLTCAMAQTTLPDGMVDLLPSGVTLSVNTGYQPEKDKNVTVAGSPSKGYYAFFTAKDSEHGEELWVTDGTAAGTRMVKDINPGAAGSSIVYLTRLGDKVLFTANDGVYGNEPWVSDGTEAGTFMIKDIHEIDSSDPIGYTQLDETRAVFAAKDFESETYGDSGQKWLWITDGTEAGTKLLAQAECRWPGRVYDNNNRCEPWMRVGRKVFFKAKDVENKYEEEVWVTDGTEAGTFMIKDINIEKTTTGTASSSPTAFMNFYNEKLVFQAWTLDAAHEPWVSDGTPEGTYMVCDINPSKSASGAAVGSVPIFPGYQPIDGRVSFRCKSTVYGNELMLLDPGKTGESAVEFFDIFSVTPTATNSSTPGPGYVWNDRLYFSANSGTLKDEPTCLGGELWCYDPATNDVRMYVDQVPGTGSFWPKCMTACGGSMYLYNAGTVKGQQSSLWRIDNHGDPITQVTFFDQGGDKIHTLRNMNGTLIFCSGATGKIYSYTYRKPNYNATADADRMEVDFEPRGGESSVDVIAGDMQQPLSVTPNPATSTATVNASSEVLKVEVVSMQGITVASAEGPTVDVSSLAPGIYIARVTAAGGNGVVRMIKK